jgi:hypothetical protein
VPLIAALTLQATPWQMGLLAAAGGAPILLVGLFAGVTRKPLPINSSTVSVAHGRRSALRCARFLAASLHGTSGQRIQVLTDVP